MKRNCSLCGACRPRLGRLTVARVRGSTPPWQAAQELINADGVKGTASLIPNSFISEQEWLYPSVLPDKTSFKPVVRMNPFGEAEAEQH